MCSLAVFPELVRRILDHCNDNDIDSQVVTLFHVNSYVDRMVDGEEDLGKLIEKLAHESKCELNSMALFT